MMMCIQNLVLFCQFILKILSKYQILTSIKDRNSVANLQKTTIYNTNLDLVNDNVYTKFRLNLSIRSHTPVPEGVSVNMRGPENFFHKSLDTCLGYKKIEGDWLESWRFR